jgi:hypothetical protein
MLNSGALKTMDAMVIGATFVGSMAMAFVVQRALLGAMLRAFGRDKAARR